MELLNILKKIKNIIKKSIIKEIKKDQKTKLENNISNIPSNINNDNLNESLKNEKNSGLFNENIYINSKFINNIKNKYNININDITKIDVVPDGNCLMSCISLFIENLYY